MENGLSNWAKSLVDGEPLGGVFECDTSEHTDESNLQPVFEMATLRQRQDRLPLNVKLDCAQKYISNGHEKRLEVQNNTNPRFTEEMFYIAIEATEKDEQGNERPKVMGTVSEQAKEHLETMLRFVEINRSNLSKLADMEMSFDEFLEIMQMPNQEDELTATTKTVRQYRGLATLSTRAYGHFDDLLRAINELEALKECQDEAIDVSELTEAKEIIKEINNSIKKLTVDFHKIGNIFKKICPTRLPKNYRNQELPIINGRISSIAIDVDCVTKKLQIFDVELIEKYAYLTYKTYITWAQKIWNLTDELREFEGAENIKPLPSMEITKVSEQAFKKETWTVNNAFTFSDIKI